MKLLILTQLVDKNDPGLSFMHRWIEVFREKFEKITVIALKVGEYSLPDNVKVLSLGKETGRSRLKYLWNFYRYIWQERKNYDAVFVHMNQEYVLLGAKHWWFMGKKIYMWRNHHAGNFLTDLAAFFCTKVFCTSKFSYTAKYKKTVIMPVGVDVEKFEIRNSKFEFNNSILFLGRIAPVKKPDLLIEALSGLKDLDWSLTIVGDALPKDSEYYQKLKEMARSDTRIVLKSGVPNIETPAIYSQHEIFVNLSSSGMYDKTIIEAMACGRLVLVSNENLRGEIDNKFVFKEGDREELKAKLLVLLSLPKDEVAQGRTELRAFAERHSLKVLAEELAKQINPDI